MVYLLQKHVETSVEQAKVLSDGSAKGIVSKKTVRTEWKRTGVLGPDFNEDEEELRLEQGLDPEELMNPINGEVVPFDRVAS
jgi:hypothetical protein